MNETNLLKSLHYHRLSQMNEKSPQSLNKFTQNVQLYVYTAYCTL